MTANVTCHAKEWLFRTMHHGSQSYQRFYQLHDSIAHDSQNIWQERQIFFNVWALFSVSSLRKILHIGLRSDRIVGSRRISDVWKIRTPTYKKSLSLTRIPSGCFWGGWGRGVCCRFRKSRIRCFKFLSEMADRRRRSRSRSRSPRRRTDRERERRPREDGDSLRRSSRDGQGRDAGLPSEVTTVVREPFTVDREKVSFTIN